MKDVIIIGAGPVGLYAAYYCGFQKLDAIVLEALSFDGGQLSNLYRDKLVYDLPGFKEITAGDFVERLEEQYSQFEKEIPIHYEEAVLDIEKESNHFKITTNKTSYKTRTILVCSGGGEFKPRKLNIPGSENFTNIHYTANIDEYVEKEVAIFGGGDSAVDFSLMINEKAKKTTIVHRRDEFRAHAHSIDVLKESSVNILTPYEVKNIEGQGEKAETFTLKEATSDNTIQLKADYFFVNFGFLPSSANYEKWGLDATKDGINVQSDTTTSVPGIFAAGNCAVYEGKIKTIAVGLGEVPKAITSIKRYLNPGKIVGTVYSSAQKK
ncbi:MAG: NAD(P)/FAD-dependent oxidoreductase [Defluviitaleaceae bacterium]|nr:NAD(P)/FAD-dependent oxidoreductase [Defluviitaleaceae bacterium]